ncbi:hypothetical protein OESDEN_11059 [Oesophagostomum dentatum]|uniref:Uncharacterized protein n=1 Tax=Oesophagostomum dentatum TaxID=61180 RepID=A0A0B1T067_OESDE|nr:hypothetical protein OESDEN_11059 [Oesophagostomum dentatum]
MILTAELAKNIELSDNTRSPLPQTLDRLSLSKYKEREDLARIIRKDNGILSEFHSFRDSEYRVFNQMLHSVYYYYDIYARNGDELRGLTANGHYCGDDGDVTCSDEREGCGWLPGTIICCCREDLCNGSSNLSVFLTIVTIAVAKVFF